MGLIDKLKIKSILILLIDDEDSFRSVIKQVLVKAGYEVVEASNGVAGIRYFYEKPADMIVTDIIVPDKEGIETKPVIEDRLRTLFL